MSSNTNVSIRALNTEDCNRYSTAITSDQAAGAEAAAHIKRDQALQGDAWMAAPLAVIDRGCFELRKLGRSQAQTSRRVDAPVKASRMFWISVFSLPHHHPSRLGIRV